MFWGVFRKVPVIGWEGGGSRVDEDAGMKYGILGMGAVDGPAKGG